MLERIAGVQFEKLEPGEFEGIPVVTTLRLRDDLGRLKTALNQDKARFLDYLEDTNQQALWILGLFEDIYGVGRNACEVLPNTEWTFNMVSHVHQDSDLDLLASRTEKPNRAPFQLFSEAACRKFILENREMLMTFIEGWSYAGVMDAFVGDPSQRALEGMVYEAHTEVMMHDLQRGELIPSTPIADEDIGKWTSILSTFFNASQVYRGGEALKVAELNWRPDGIIPWSRFKEPSCVVFRGMHRGSAQIEPPVWNSAVIQNAVLFASRGFIPGW